MVNLILPLHIHCVQSQNTGQTTTLTFIDG